MSTPRSGWSPSQLPNPAALVPISQQQKVGGNPEKVGGKGAGAQKVMGTSQWPP